MPKEHGLKILGFGPACMFIGQQEKWPVPKIAPKEPKKWAFGPKKKRPALPKAPKRREITASGHTGSFLPDLEVIDGEGGRVLDAVVLVELGRQGLAQLVAQTLPSHWEDTIFFTLGWGAVSLAIYRRLIISIIG